MHSQFVCLTKHKVTHKLVMHMDIKELPRYKASKKKN